MIAILNFTRDSNLCIIKVDRSSLIRYFHVSKCITLVNKLTLDSVVILNTPESSIVLRELTFCDRHSLFPHLWSHKFSEIGRSNLNLSNLELGCIEVFRQDTGLNIVVAFALIIEFGWVMIGRTPLLFITVNSCTFNNFSTIRQLLSIFMYFLFLNCLEDKNFSLQYYEFFSVWLPFDTKIVIITWKLDKRNTSYEYSLSCILHCLFFNTRNNFILIRVPWIPLTFTVSFFSLVWLITKERYHSWTGSNY